MAEENKDFFKSLLSRVKDILAPGINLLSDPQSRAEFLGSLGIQDTGTALAAAPANSLDEYIASESQEVDAFKLASALADLTQLMLSIEGFFRAAIAADSDSEFSAGEALDTFTNMLVLDYIRRRQPTIHSTIRLLSVLSQQTAEQGGSVKFIKEVVFGFFERLGKGFENFESEEDAKVVSDSIFLLLGAGLFIINQKILKGNGIESVSIESGYGFEGVSQSATPVADSIADRSFTYSVSFTPLDDPDNIATLYNTLSLVPKSQGGISLVTDLAGKLDATLPIDENRSLKFDFAGEGIFRVGESPEAEAGKNNKAAISYTDTRKDPTLWSLLDKPSIKIGIGTYMVGFKISPDDFEVKTKIEMPFKFGRGGLSGFPFELLPEKIEEKIPIAFGYSLKRNFFFGDGSAGTDPKAPSTMARTTGEPAEDPGLVAGIAKMVLNAIDFRIPLHQNVGGVLGLQLLNVRTGVEGNFDTIQLETSLDFWLKFGSVLTLSVSRLGMLLTLAKREDNGGVGGYDISPKIKLPNGIGVRVNAEIIKGGGFLYIDEERGEYFGALELEFKNLFSLKAVGLINTIMPDGSKGFSMIVIITAEFSPIQLGFGFTLLAVGGLLGLNRTVQVEPLRIGIKTNAIKSILFPEDVVGNISRIISDIREIFPVKQDQFLIGLMAKFGWGTPTLIKIELGVIVEVPDPKILILGVISTKLPTEEAAVLKLQVNFLGVIDFQNKFIYFEAHLFDSMLVGFPLTGSMAFVVAWGNTSLFAISIGGFHPDFKDYPSVPTLPGAFREMTRIGLSLLSGKNPRLTIECYIAITSNTIQFGAKLELLASGPMGFNLYGMLAFDAIFIFDPFSFGIALEATLAIRKNTSILFGIHFKGVLSGPTPWHVEGEVTFGVLFFDVTIGFSATWGDRPSEITRVTVDLLEKVKQEIFDIRNWRTELAEHQHQAVTLKKPEDEENAPVVLFPFGELRFSQRSIPLNYKIETYGSQVPLDVNLIRISKVKIGSEEEATDDEKEMFSPGHFTKLSESEKLSRKSYEALPSGFKLKDSGKLLTASPHLDPVVMDYELDYTNDDKNLPFKLSIYAFDNMKRYAAASKSELSWLKTASKPLNSPGKVEVEHKGFAIAKTSNLTEYDASFRATTLAEVNNFYDNLIRSNPSLAHEIQVVERYELAEV
ncbi:hypothetical protein B0I27_104297 [Arcticibacter pallidicorallinus]|uniref:DUF6603 domain-containing protein n=1 Tax=Arcticibacter pallidicorallinus TaxID=1259464 RepID=A0A2T0U5T9_9SPHI|nr:DUF6603 domain-containing protein [Arcticibacter pallidicorallinus]PRY53287.1 hypothetical protein B0I27_104297 [Arcticibacter pallidicorallinus]